MECKTRYPAHDIRPEIEGGLAPQTIHGFVRSLRTFASWLQRKGYTEDNIFQAIKPPKLPQTLIQPLTEDEIRRLLLAVPRDTHEGGRSYAIVLLFLDTGIRLSELVNLKISDIDFGTVQDLGQGCERAPSADGIDSAAISHRLISARQFDVDRVNRKSWS